MTEAKREFHGAAHIYDSEHDNRCESNHRVPAHGDFVDGTYRYVSPRRMAQLSDQMGRCKANSHRVRFVPLCKRL